jgi:diphthamide biosynthesis methyltransferase
MTVYYIEITSIITTIISLCAISFLVYGNSVSFAVYAQSNLQTIKYRNLVIDLGNGVKTNAQLTLPYWQRAISWYSSCAWGRPC